MVEGRGTQRGRKTRRETGAGAGAGADAGVDNSSPSIAITPAMRPDFVLENLGVLADANI